MSESEVQVVTFDASNMTDLQARMLRLAVDFYRDAFMSGFLVDPAGCLEILSGLQGRFGSESRLLDGDRKKSASEARSMTTEVTLCDCPEGPTLRWDVDLCSACGHHHDQLLAKSANHSNELYRAISELEPDAVATLLYLANRLLVGQRAYGKIDLRTDPRDWKHEIRAEIGDLLVYFAFEELKHQLSPEGSIEAAARARHPTTEAQRQAAEVPACANPTTVFTSEWTELRSLDRRCHTCLSATAEPLPSLPAGDAPPA